MGIVGRTEGRVNWFLMRRVAEEVLDFVKIGSR